MHSRTLFGGLLVLMLMLMLGFHPSSRAWASICAGDIDDDGVVTIEDLINSVNAAIDGCEALTSARLLASNQQQCDGGDGTLGTCPGIPAGQDGEILAGFPLSYDDRGDGTIRDQGTGLSWEKLSSDISIHNFEQSYTWTDAFNKISALNTPPCFADHCDWRLPNRRELESLVDTGHAGPSIDPTFNTGCTAGCSVVDCSCTQLDNYWTSTSYQDPNLAGFAWTVDFNLGAVNGFEKTLPAYFVRAVRGGR